MSGGDRGGQGQVARVLGTTVLTDPVGSRLRVIVVDDDPTMADLLRMLLVRNPEISVDVALAASLGELSALLDGSDTSQWGEVGSGRPDVVLLDLNLPDSEGLRTVRETMGRLAEPYPDEERPAVVVVSSMTDLQVATQALSLGVQDYVLKEDVTGPLLVRVLRYAIARTQLLREVADARRGEERERELRRLERLHSGASRVSARSLGAGSLAERAPRAHDEVVEEYVRILAQAVERHAYLVDNHDALDDVRALAAVLGFLGAGPRDVVEVHAAGMRAATRQHGVRSMQVLAEEGRLLVLRLMGEALAWYRSRAIAGSGPSPDSDGRPAVLVSRLRPTDDPAEDPTDVA